jgi:hypothetical protein
MGYSQGCCSGLSFGTRPKLDSVVADSAKLMVAMARVGFEKEGIIYG